MEETFYQFGRDGNSEKTAAWMMMCRRLDNCVSVLEKYEQICEIKSEVSYIRQEYSDYHTLVSEKIKDFVYLSESRNVLKNMRKILAANVTALWSNYIN